MVLRRAGLLGGTPPPGLKGRPVPSTGLPVITRRSQSPRHPLTCRVTVSLLGGGHTAQRCTLHPGPCRLPGTCAHRQAFATFLQWFLTSDIVEGVLKGMAIAPLPSVVRTQAPVPMTPPPSHFPALGRRQPAAEQNFHRLTVPIHPSISDVCSRRDVETQRLSGSGNCFVSPSVLLPPQ